MPPSCTTSSALLTAEEASLQERLENTVPRDKYDRRTRGMVPNNSYGQPPLRAILYDNLLRHYMATAQKGEQLIVHLPLRSTSRRRILSELVAWYGLQEEAIVPDLEDLKYLRVYDEGCGCFLKSYALKDTRVVISKPLSWKMDLRKKRSVQEITGWSAPQIWIDNSRIHQQEKDDKDRQAIVRPCHDRLPSLPRVCIVEIFRFLTYDDGCCGSSVSKKFHAALQAEESLWKGFYKAYLRKKANIELEELYCSGRGGNGRLTKEQILDKWDRCILEKEGTAEKMRRGADPDAKNVARFWRTLCHQCYYFCCSEEPACKYAPKHSHPPMI